METIYQRASIISLDELALALSGMNASKKKEIGIAELTLPELTILLADVARAQKLLQELGIRGGYYLKEYRGRKYVVLKGYAGLRRYITGTIYLAENPKVVRMGIGPIAFRNAVRANLILALTMYTSLAVVEYLSGDEVALEELLGDLIVDGTSTALSIVAGSLASAAVGMYVTMALPAIGAGLVAGFVVSYLMSTVDEERRISTKLSKALVATAEAFNRGVIRAREVVQNAFNWTYPVEEDKQDTLLEEDVILESPMDYEGSFGMDFSEQEGADFYEGPIDDFYEAPIDGGERGERPGTGLDLDFDGEVFEVKLIESGSGEPVGPAEYGEVGEEGRIRGGSDDNDPIGGSN